MNYTESNYPQDGIFKKNDTITFNYTGAYKAILLNRGQYKFECWGAEGGTSPGYAPGGKGGYTVGTLNLPTEVIFYIYVGQKGVNGGSGNYNAFNGGGAPALNHTYTAGGGGASDIRLGGTSWNDLNSLLSRIMVAAAGGGGGAEYGVGNEYAGDGGGLIGMDANSTKPGYENMPQYGKGATQTQGGGPVFGGFGFGANAVSVMSGGGGSGYYGGGSQRISPDAGGGGGSSFISGLSGCNAVDENGIHTNQSIHFSGLYFENAETQTGIRAGNGLVRITVLKESEQPYTYLVDIGGSVKFKQNNVFYNINKNINTVDLYDFTDYGMSTVELLNTDAHKIDILISTFIQKPKLMYKFVPNNQLIINSDLISLDGLSLITKMNAVNTVSTTAQIKYILHNNVNWYTIKDAQWFKILDTDLNADYINTNGLTSTQLENLTQEQIDLFINYLINKKIKFASSLSKTNYDDTINLQKIFLSGNSSPYKKIWISPNLYDETDNDEYLELFWETNNKNKIEIIYDLYNDKNCYNNYTYPKDGNLSQGKKIIFHYTGHYQELLLNHGTYKFECYGASGEGGNPFSNTIGCRRGFGGYTSGIITINEPTIFYLYVGGSGIGNIAGWNGGGKGIVSGNNIAGAGGGASDIRLVKEHWSHIDSLRSRIMVAAGGAGSNYWYDYGRQFIGTGVKTTSREAGDGSAGNGGGLIGTNGFTNGKINLSIVPGDQLSGYKFGIGQSQTAFADAGAGGAGYYGGFAGIVAKSGGAGGSSFISGLDGCNAIDKFGIHTNQPIHFSGLYFDDALTTEGIRDGDGVIIVTAI